MIIQKSINVAAGVSVENVFAGSTFEFPRSNSLVSMGVVATGVSIQVTILAGGTIVLEESPVAVSSDFPLIPDEFYYNFAMLAGERLVLRVRNAGGSALDVRAIAQMTAVR